MTPTLQNNWPTAAARRCRRIYAAAPFHCSPSGERSKMVLRPLHCGLFSCPGIKSRHAVLHDMMPSRAHALRSAFNVCHAIGGGLALKCRQGSLSPRPDRSVCQCAVRCHAFAALLAYAPGHSFISPRRPPPSYARFGPRKNPEGTYFAMRPAGPQLRQPTRPQNLINRTTVYKWENSARRKPTKKKDGREEQAPRHHNRLLHGCPACPISRQTFDRVCHVIERPPAHLFVEPLRKHSAAKSFRSRSSSGSRLAFSRNFTKAACAQSEDYGLASNKNLCQSCLRARSQLRSKCVREAP